MQAGDYDEFDAKMDQAVASAEDPSAKLNLECIKLAYRYGTGQQQNLSKLEALRVAHPDNPLPTTWIAYCFEMAQEYERAVA